MHTNRGLSNSNTSLEFCSYRTSNNSIKLVMLARFQALTAVLLKNQAFWDVTMCHWASIFWYFKTSATTRQTTRCHNPQRLNIVAHLIRKQMGHKAINVVQVQQCNNKPHKFSCCIASMREFSSARYWFELYWFLICSCCKPTATSSSDTTEKHGVGLVSQSLRAASKHCSGIWGHKCEGALTL